MMLVGYLILMQVLFAYPIHGARLTMVNHESSPDGSMTKVFQATFRRNGDRVYYEQYGAVLAAIFKLLQSNNETSAPKPEGHIPAPTTERHVPAPVPKKSKPSCRCSKC
ncbi:uncharacterized protein [Periplaneta americana]|uniref:uncharacterized protein n=1 Tax=Periplaneta americana TaxID=6978 RepID=UPI0037E7F028